MAVRSSQLHPLVMAVKTRATRPPAAHRSGVGTVFRGRPLPGDSGVLSTQPPDSRVETLTWIGLLARDYCPHADPEQDQAHEDRDQ